MRVPRSAAVTDKEIVYARREGGGRRAMSNIRRDIRQRGVMNRFGTPLR